MRFGKLIGLLFGSLVLAMARAACAEVIITYPTNGATVNGTITVTAQITSAWWSKLWVDGKGIAVSGIGNVSFTWKTNSFANGTHTLQVDAYPSGKPANAAETIKINVNNSGTSPVGHFYTLAASASLPNDETCAAEIPWEQEMVPNNQGAEQYQTNLCTAPSVR